MRASVRIEDTATELDRRGGEGRLGLFAILKRPAGRLRGRHDFRRARAEREHRDGRDDRDGQQGANASFAWWRAMVQSIPRAIEATDVEAATETASPAASRVAALEVAPIQAVGADVMSISGRARTMGKELATAPRSARRSRKRARARASSTLNRTHRPPELLGGLDVGQSFEVAEHDRQPESVRKAIDLLVKLGPAIEWVGSVRMEDRHLGTSTFVGPASGGGDSRLGRDANRDGVQPAADHLSAPDRSRPPGQDQERRLGSVLGVVDVAKELPARRQDHRRMPLDQGRESGFRRLPAPGVEAIQQLRIRQGSDGAFVEEHLKVPLHQVRSQARHHFRLPLPCRCPLVDLKCPARVNSELVKQSDCRCRIPDSRSHKPLTC